MKSMVSRSVVWASLSLFLIAAAISVGQSVGTMIGKAEAQALIQNFSRSTLRQMRVPSSTKSGPC